MVQRRIEWPDADASGTFHDTVASRFIDVAETVLLDRLGFVDQIYGRHPRVRIEADFLRPLRFRDVVDIELAVEKVVRSTVTYRLEIRSADGVAVQGRAVSVLLSKAGGEPVRWPDDYRQRLLTAGRRDGSPANGSPGPEGPPLRPGGGAPPP